MFEDGVHNNQFNDNDFKHEIKIINLCGPTNFF